MSTVEEELSRLLSFADSPGTSLHLLPGRAPFLREGGETWLLDANRVTNASLQEIIDAVLSPSQIESLDSNAEVYSEHTVHDNRFRVSMVQTEAGVHAVFRRMSGDSVATDIEEFRPIYAELASMRRGLVVVCGPIATDNQVMLEALTAWTSKNRSGHLVAVETRPGRCYEDPSCMLHQLEVGRHVRSLAEGTNLAVSMQADIVTATHIDSRETFRSLLAAAEAGLVVMSAIEAPDFGIAFETFREFGGPRTHVRLAFCLQLLALRRRLARSQAGEEPRFEHTVLTNTEEIADILLHGEAWAHDLMPTAAGSLRG